MINFIINNRRDLQLKKLKPIHSNPILLLKKMSFNQTQILHLVLSFPEKTLVSTYRHPHMLLKYLMLFSLQVFLSVALALGITTV